MELSILNQLKDGKSQSFEYWIKHPDLEDEARLEFLNGKYLSLAVKRKIPLEKEAISLANKLGSWTETNQRDYDSSRAYHSRIKENYEKVIEAHKKHYKEDLDSIALKIQGLEQKKRVAIGKTAEEWATKMSTERYIFSLFYKDKNLTSRAWDDEESEMLEQKEVDRIFVSFFEYRNKFRDDKLKEMACSGFCQNLYCVAGNPLLLFGRSMLELTCAQQRFIILLENYKNIISNISGKIPDSTLTDWQQLDKWAKSTERGRDELEKKWSTGPGASDNKINFENIRKASMVEGDHAEKKAAMNLLS